MFLCYKNGLPGIYPDALYFTLFSTAKEFLFWISNKYAILGVSIKAVSLS
jgi:hypothetical protein